MLSQNDWTFIDVINKKAPFLRVNFEAALNVSAFERLEWAQDRLYDIKRKRYMKRGVPEHDTETVGDHTMESIGLATLHTPDYCLRDVVEQMILIHDLPQAIIDNLKCDDSISAKDKKRTEHLAAQVIFQNNEKAFELWQEYEQGETHEARVAKDIQHAQMLMKISEYQRNYPKTRLYFAHYWEQLAGAWVSDIGKNLHQLLIHDLSVHAANDSLENTGINNTA